jgi:DNA mismatch repair ATPase MutL
MRALENRKPDKHTSSPFFEPKIQKKLKTGKAGDPFEAEADKVADQATNNHSADGGLLQSKEELPQKSISGTISSVQSKDIKEEKDPVQKKEQDKEESVQKKTEEKEEPLQKKDEEKEEPVQKKPDEKEEPVQKKEAEKEEPVQKKTEEKEAPIQKKEEEKPVSTIEHNLKKGGGNPLEKDIKLEMENFFGVDFSSIRIHTDGKAAAMCHEMGAQAFTNGTDIYFNKGKYNPNSVQGKKLLAHELTHTVQQGAVNQKKK